MALPRNRGARKENTAPGPDVPSRFFAPAESRRDRRKMDGLADDGLSRGGDDGHWGGAIEGVAAIDMLFHDHDGDEHDGDGHAAEHQTNNSQTATVSHDPLP
jgi:hypothetical protein